MKILSEKAKLKNLYSTTAAHGEVFWDVAVIGGGPAGMMAAGIAAARGAKVIVIEKNTIPGKKLLITGGGRCNVTNAEFDTRALLSKFRDNDKFLFSAFSQWSVQETLEFFHRRGMETKVEALKRVFPASNNAQSVWNVLVAYMKEKNVTVLSSMPVRTFVEEGGSITAARLQNGADIRARSFILATGGRSRPETGSTGDGFEWLKRLGHTVVEPEPSLVPLTIKDTWIKSLAGVTLSDIKLTVFAGGKKQLMKKGKLLFTHVGVSGPTVLNMSKDVRELLKYEDYGDVILSLDLLPALDYSALNTKLQDIFKDNINKKFKNAVSELVPTAMIPIIIELSGISPDTFCHSVTREERVALIKLLKDIPMKIKGLLGAEKAIVTSGGVVLDEVDFKTMRSRRVENLYVVGDMLNIDRPSGGYSLQLCWTTGYVAGNAVPLESASQSPLISESE